jgi:hypothetical protein
MHTNPTANWVSTYRGTTAESTLRPKLVSHRPSWSIARTGYSSSRGFYNTEFGDTIGKYGDNPRDILPHDAPKQENLPRILNMGTQKVTSHTPGYNGFIPNSDINWKAVEQSKGQKVRNTIIK